MMMKKLALAFSITVFAFLFQSISAQAHPGHEAGLIHLKFAKGTVHAHATWKQGPRTPEESILRIEWKNGADHSPIEPPGTFSVKLYMPAMKHGSSPTQMQRVLDDKGQPMTGVYTVSNIYFTMGGDWDVQVALKNTSGTEEVQTFKVHVDDSGQDHHHG